MTIFFEILFSKIAFLLIAKYAFVVFSPVGTHVVNLEEVPVIDLNFYLMNRSDVDVEIFAEIRENVAYLNQEFENKIRFDVKHFFVDEGYALLPDLHQEYFGVQELTIDSLAKNLEVTGGVNVFVFDSYLIEELNAELMGFTPIFRASHKDYEKVSPSFDRIFLAYSALVKKTTLVHEMGHFLGLDHPWEMSELNKDLMGLVSSEDITNNHMAYGLSVESFTYEQLMRMQHFALQFRGYLVARTDYAFTAALASMAP